MIEVLRPVRVVDDAAFAELSPGPAGFDLSMSIAFEAAAIGSQSLALRLSPASFRAELSRARTFALAGDVARLRQAGLGLGGSLDNAVVVDGACVVNPGGLRMPDEFVRHKLLDAVGDLALGGRAALRPLPGASHRPCPEQPPAARAVRRRRQLALAARE